MASEFKYVPGIICECGKPVGQYAQATRHARRFTGSPDLGNICAECLDKERMQRLNKERMWHEKTNSCD